MPNKITTKQAYTLFMLAAFSPLISQTSAMGARLGGRTGWLSLFISCAAFYGLIALFCIYFRRSKNTDLYSLYKSAFGKIIAKILVLIYAVWVFLLAGFYLQAFSEKFTGLIMPGVPAGFFTITLLALVYIILSGRFQSFAILSNICFYVALLAIAVIFLLQIPQIKPQNLLPVTQFDVPNIMQGVLPTLGIFAYITPLLFLGGEIVRDDVPGVPFRKYGLYSAGTLLAVNIIIFMTTVGVFGKDLTAQMEQPFLMSVKTVGAQGALERLESVFLLLWVVTDLAIIVMLMHILLKLLGFIAGRGAGFAPIKALLIVGVYALAQILVVSEMLGLRVNLVMGFGVPVVAVVIYMFKTSFSKTPSKPDTPSTTRKPPLPD